MEQILCSVVESSCLLTHNIAPHISFHDLPYHKTMKRYENSQSMEVFLLLPLKFAIQAWLCNCPQYLCLLHLVFECSPRKHAQGKMLVLQNRLLYWVLTFHIGSMFCFFPANWMSSTYTDKNNPIYGVRITIPNWKPSPNRFPIELSRIAFPITVLPKDDRTDFAQEERLGLSILDHDLGHLCRGGRIQISGHSDLGIFNNLGASSIFTWV